MEDLFDRWFAGWRASRDLPAAEVTDDGLWIHCAQPSREFEVFALHADDDPASIPRLAAKVLAMKEHTWLTLPTHRSTQTAAAVEAAGMEVLHRSEWLMSIDLTGHPHRAPGPGYTCTARTEGPAIHVSVHDEAGELAARGQLGLAGEDAVPDRIETMPDHRRRGLGSVVMSALAAEALAQGARTGLLIASVDGQGLYSALGWEHVADVVISQAPAA